MLEDFKIKVFLCLASQGSFTAAARELGVSQPAVSQNIAELEKATGQQLFARSQGAIALTPQGELFKRYALRIAENYEKINVIFADYDSFKDYSERYGELVADPRFDIVK